MKKKAVNKVKKIQDTEKCQKKISSFFIKVTSPKDVPNTDAHTGSTNKKRKASAADESPEIIPTTPEVSLVKNKRSLRKKSVKENLEERLNGTKLEVLSAKKIKIVDDFFDVSSSEEDHFISTASKKALLNKDIPPNKTPTKKQIPKAAAYTTAGSDKKEFKSIVHNNHNIKTIKPVNLSRTPEKSGSPKKTPIKVNNTIMNYFQSPSKTALEDSNNKSQNTPSKPNNSVMSTTPFITSPSKKATPSKSDTACSKKKLFKELSPTCDLSGIDFGDDFNLNSDKENYDDNKHVTPVKSPSQNSVLRDFMDEDDFEYEETEAETLDLSRWQRCQTLEYTFQQNLKGSKAKFKCMKTGETGTCLIQRPWCNYNLNTGDIVSIIAVSSKNCITPWIINDSGGFLVTTPDFLVSGTSVVGGLFCARKAILSDVYKGLDGGNKIMTIGSLVHELLQNILEVSKKSLITRLECERHIQNILNDPQSMVMLYDSGMTMKEAKEEMNKFVEKIVDFVKIYIKHEKIKSSYTEKSNWIGNIQSIVDIEENIWSPSLGLKGKVDVTVLVKLHPKGNKVKMPLELKTGRASFSAEHKGQVMLYSMMMSEMGYNVDSGLLLYLREGVMKEVSIKHHEKRDLIMLRNELALFLSRKSLILKHNDNKTKKDNANNNEIGENILDGYLPDLPPPISNKNACMKCPYITICSLFLSKQKDTEISNSNPLRELMHDALWHISASHIDYFIRWTSMLYLEDLYKPTTNANSSLWTEQPVEREKSGKSLSNLAIEEVLRKGDRYLHSFVRNSANVAQTNSFLQSGFVVGDYVIISTDSRINIVCGTVNDLSINTLKIMCDRDITTRYGRICFHVDLYESQTLLSFNLTNLGVLLDSTESSDKMRRLIIDKQKPTYCEKLPQSTADIITKYTRNLNSDQKQAISKCLTADDYVLIQGMPGTGKTQTIVALVHLLSKLNKSVLITSHTHSAVDNVLLKLHDLGLEFLRLGADSRIHPKIKHKGEHHAITKCSNFAELETVFEKAMIVAVTCLGSAHPILSRRKFDVCLVDESTQVLQSSILRPLFSANVFVLIGDPEQLPPLVRSRDARQHGLDESLFSSLKDAGGTVILSQQYRMNSAITNIANLLTYNGKLKCGNDEVANAVVKYSGIEKVLELYKSQVWLRKLMSYEIEDSVKIINTGNTFDQCLQYLNQELKHLTQMKPDVTEEINSNQENKEGRTCSNICEVAVVIYIISALLESGIEPKSIGIIAPYRVQVELLQKLVTKYESNSPKKTNSNQFENIEVNTVDQFQGRDKDIIIYSCTKTTNLKEPKKDKPVCKSDGEILNDKRRLTVAITRAKQKLIIVGDLLTLSDYEPFKKLFKCVEDEHKILLGEKDIGFSWSTIFDYLNDSIKLDKNSVSISEG